MSEELEVTVAGLAPPVLIGPDTAIYPRFSTRIDVDGHRVRIDIEVVDARPVPVSLSVAPLIPRRP